MPEPRKLDIYEEIAINIEKMKNGFNDMVEGYEGLPELKPVRKQILEDAMHVIMVTMDGIIKELIDEGGRI